MKHLNKPWRLTHEEITYVDHARMLFDPDSRARSGVPFQNTFEQCPAVRPDPALPALAHPDDEIHGARSFLNGA